MGGILLKKEFNSILNRFHYVQPILLSSPSFTILGFNFVYNHTNLESVQQDLIFLKESLGWTVIGKKESMGDQYSSGYGFCVFTLIFFWKAISISSDCSAVVHQIIFKDSITIPHCLKLFSNSPWSTASVLIDIREL